MTLLIRDAEVAGCCRDVVVDGEVVTEVVAPGQFTTKRIDDMVEGRGGALVPGLADHHLHLLALAAADSSVDLRPRSTPDRAALVAALRQARPDTEGWIRAVGYTESVAGLLDRWSLDEIRDDVPVRVQHRSGALWILNTRALEWGSDTPWASPEVERDVDGRLTGRIWRGDHLLHRLDPGCTPDLAQVGRRLAALGITAVTDATPDLDHTAVDQLCTAHGNRELPPDLLLLGADDEPEAGGVHAGPRKIVVSDHNLPALDELVGRVEAAHLAQRGVAVHVVTREALLLTLTALDVAGRHPDDRVEHASVVPLSVIPRLRGLTVVTQPGFIAERGEDYRREVDARDLTDLYRMGSLQAHGVDVVCSSDAPFGPLDPWLVIATAARRLTNAGLVLGDEERITTEAALGGMLTTVAAPGRARRVVAPGAPADVVLLHAPLGEALREPSRDVVRGTWWRGRQVFAAD